MKIRIWYGDTQRVGHLGDAQDDFNLLGDVADAESLQSLTCVVNGKLPPWPLSVGRRADGFGDGRRLARTGHFNADIPVASLAPGENKVILAATWSDGHAEEAAVTVLREEGGERPLPMVVEWAKVDRAEQVGTCVDGDWIVEGGALRTAHTGYDRVCLLGERSWKDYEATVPVTIHHVDRETGPHSGGNGIGLLFRFVGHVAGGPRHFPPGQPKWGYQPFGAITWLRFMGGAAEPPQKQFYRGDGDGVTNHGAYAIEEGATYWMKGSCRSGAERGVEGVTTYRFKVWRDGEAEPGRWAFEETQKSATSLRTGGLVLLAHHVDASFGDVRIKEL